MPSQGVLRISCAILPISTMTQGSEEPARWTVHITNDNCPDYTWGLSEEATRKAFADIVSGHLDAMARTDAEPSESRDRYNMAVTQEALCFVEAYPDRTEELVRRIREGRLFVSPFLCNTLWGFQSAEGAVRAFYPARRLERRWGIPLDGAQHIEDPSLPWGMAALLPACGIRWLSVAFLDYDCTFQGLRAPPLFELEGPDGSRLRVALDAWASRKANYTQGALILKDTGALLKEWIPHYASLGADYPIPFFLASGTHGDISPSSGGQAWGFAEAILRHNAGLAPRPRLVNATLTGFFAAVDAAERERPCLKTLRGTFGDSWELWPLSLARTAGAMRTGEQAFLAAEALLSIASAADPALPEALRPERERAEWCWSMLADHAWNGTDEGNRRLNAALRRRWAGDLEARGGAILRRSWEALGLDREAAAFTLFNGSAAPRADLARIALAAGLPQGVRPARVPWQVVLEDNADTLCFVSPPLGAYGLAGLSWETGAAPAADPSAGAAAAGLRAGPLELESPFHHLQVDPATGGLRSLRHKPSGAEAIDGSAGRSLGQVIHFDGKEHVLQDVRTEVTALGPVLARLRIRGSLEGGIEVEELVTAYAVLDRIDLDVRIRKPARRGVEERLCLWLPILGAGRSLRIESTGAVVRPRERAGGDLLPGADPRRFVVQGFADASAPQGPGVTIAPLESFALRLDLGPPAFELLGNDQNFKEVSQDQDGETDFRFRFALKVHAGGFDAPGAFAWSRSVASPLLVAPGKARRPEGGPAIPSIALDPGRAVALCLKPADDPAAGGLILRVQETAGLAAPLVIPVTGFTRARRTDLLERDQEELPVKDGKVELPVRPHGFAAVRLR